MHVRVCVWKDQKGSLGLMVAIKPLPCQWLSAFIPSQAPVWNATSSTLQDTGGPVDRFNTSVHSWVSTCFTFSFDAKQIKSQGLPQFLWYRLQARVDTKNFRKTCRKVLFAAKADRS